MRVTSRARIVGAATLLLLCLPLARLICPRSTAPKMPLAARLVRPARPRSPSEEALWRARWYRMRAQQAVNQERYGLLERNPPEATRGTDVEDWRRRLMAQDPSGDVRRALAAAREAASLSRTPEEEYRAREWLVLIECDAGDHREELRQARRLVSLQPKNEISWTSLRRAAHCNRQPALARRAAARIAAIRGRHGTVLPADE
jgi:hypothetical protein